MVDGWSGVNFESIFFGKKHRSWVRNTSAVTCGKDAPCTVVSFLSLHVGVCHSANDSMVDRGLRGPLTCHKIW